MTGQSVCERQQVVTRFLSRVKKLHTHLLRERGEKMPFECTAAAYNCSLENGRGICIVKGLRGERWGTLTSSLWAEDSHINCSAGRLPSLSMGFMSAVPGEIPQPWIQQLNTYLTYCSLKVSAESGVKRWRLMYLKAAPDPVCQKHVCRYLSNGLSLETCHIAQGWQNIHHLLTH